MYDSSLCNRDQIVFALPSFSLWRKNDGRAVIWGHQGVTILWGHHKRGPIQPSTSLSRFDSRCYFLIKDRPRCNKGRRQQWLHRRCTVFPLTAAWTVSAEDIALWFSRVKCMLCSFLIRWLVLMVCMSFCSISCVLFIAIWDGELPFAADCEVSSSLLKLALLSYQYLAPIWTR